MKKTKHLNAYYYVGIIALVSTLTLREFFTIPEALEGFGMGLSITLLLFSIISQTSSFTKIRAFKRKLFSKES